ncbi:MAG: DegV family protein [Anaerolineales bacterium]|nr:DegV family protein [Anaerolineales bacterium]
MAIRIVTDSTCDLPAPLAEQFCITVIPCYVNIGEQSFLDGVDLTRQEFYERLPTYRSFPKTAAPGIEMFTQAYEELIDAGATEILSIHLSSTLSGLFDVAQIAAREVTHAPVTPFDSRQLSLGLGWQAVTAARMAAAGKTLPEITMALRDQIARSYSCAVIDTLEYLRRGGRISRIMEGLGTALQIKPLFRVHDGQIIIEKTRTRKGAQDRLMNLMQEWGALEHAVIVYADRPERGEELHQLIRQKFPMVEIEMHLQVTPIIGAHLGLGTAGIVCVTEKRVA